MSKILPSQPDHQFREKLLDVLERIVAAIERREERDEEYRAAYLNAKFPYGDHKTDHWGRRR